MMKISKSDSSASGHYEDGSGIYRIRNYSNGKSYIGETHQFCIRTYQHCTDLRCGRHKLRKCSLTLIKGTNLNFH